MRASGEALFKKKPGMIAIMEERKPPILEWRAQDGSVTVPLVKIVLSLITHLKATPASSAKMMIKVFSKESENSENITEHVFSFNARHTMDSIKDDLQLIITRYRSAHSTPTPQVPTTTAQENSNTLAKELKTLLDSKMLMGNYELQRNFLLANKPLKKTFEETVMKGGLASEEFWGTRIHLLRTFALANTQKQGPYHVLSTIRPITSSDNETNVSVTLEKIHAIFEQYPVVRKAYDENVPKMSEKQFWTKFFESRLFRKLRGDKVSSVPRGELIFEEYLDCDENGVNISSYDKQKQSRVTSKDQPAIKIHRFLDLGGNEEDNTETLGNRPDITMQEGKNKEIVNILQSMNRLSSKMVFNQQENETQRDSEDSEAEEIILSDLEESEKTEYVQLHVKSRFDDVASDKDSTKEPERKKRKLDDTENHNIFYQKFTGSFNNEVDLQTIYGTELKPSIHAASKQVHGLLRTNAKQSCQAWQTSKTWNEESNEHSLRSVFGSDSTSRENAGLTEALFEEIQLVHGTSIEFLQHFWLHFTSGDPTQAISTKRLAESIGKCKIRVDAVLNGITDSSEKERAVLVLKSLANSIDTALIQYENAMNE